MKALVLAGGLGTRLRPLTNTRPKHLLPIGGHAHLEHVFAMLAGAGVTEVVLLTSYLAEAFTGMEAAARSFGLALSFTREEEPLGTAGALRNALDLAGTETFIAINGDILTDVSLERLVAFHRERGAEATLGLTRVDDPSAFGVVPTDAGGRVTEFVEKPAPGTAPTNAINAGLYVLEPPVLERIPPGVVSSAERELFPAIASEGALFALALEGYWMDIGTPEKYLRANLDLLDGRYGWAGSAPDEAGCIVDASVRIHPTAAVVRSCLGPAVEVGPGTSVTDSVLLAGARVEPGASVVGSIIGERAVVRPEVSLHDEVLADEEHR